jgi:mono/diheme cytochrome c family protein
MKPITTALIIYLFATASTAPLLAHDEEPWVAPSRAAKKKNPVVLDENSLAKGKVLYIKECLSCHGPTGKGDGPGAKDLEVKPHDLSAPKLREQTDGALFWKITEGRKPMPGYAQTFSDEDRWHLVNYIRSLVPKDQTATSTSAKP